VKNMYQEISVIDDDITLIQRLNEIFKSENDYIFNRVNS
jgi:hypothetical protein